MSEHAARVRERQDPLRKRYREAPEEARITDHAVASSAAAEQCSVVLQTLCGGVSVTTRFSEPALDAAAG